MKLVPLALETFWELWGVQSSLTTVTGDGRDIYPSVFLACLFFLKKLFLILVY
jgi:hypothetical protein